MFEYVPSGLTSEVVCGDTLKHLKSLPSERYELIVTSPPYNIGKEYEKRIAIEEYLELQEGVISELVRLTAANGSICWQVGNYVRKGEVYPLDIFYYSIFKKFGLKLRNRIVWHFGHGLHASKRFSGRYETILWFTKTDDYIFNLDNVRVPSKYPGKRHFKGPKKGQLSGNPKGKNPSDIWQIMQRDWESGMWNIPNVKSNHPEKTGHPCQFPVELVERCVLVLSNPKGWVLDPYGGVGSTAIACLKNDRNVTSIDRDKKYCKLAKERIELLREGELKLRPMTKPIHKPSKRDKIAQTPHEWKLL